MSEAAARVEALTRQMLEAAASEDWSETQRLAALRAALLEAEFANLSPVEATELAASISRADRMLREGALSRRREVERALGEFGERLNAARAYLDAASAEA